jgi:hypothetical protein
VCAIKAKSHPKVAWLECWETVSGKQESGEERFEAHLDSWKCGKPRGGLSFDVILCLTPGPSGRYL